MGAERDLLGLLEEPEVDGEGGGVESAALSLRWGPEGIEATRLQGPVRLDHVVLTPETLASVQLHRAWSRRPPSWLQRLMRREGSVEAWLCAQFRGKRGERLRLSARLPSDMRADIQVQPREGTGVAFNDLFAALGWARHLGARLVYMEAEPDALVPPEGLGEETDAPAVQEARLDASLETGPLEDRVLERLRARGLGDIVRRVNSMRAERSHLERELDEVEQRISRWDRLFFFLSTPDSERAKELRGEIGRLDGELETANAFIDPIFTDVSRVYPVVGFGVALSSLWETFEDAFLSHRSHTLAGRKARRELRERVASIRAELMERYLPGVDLGALVGELGDLERCRQRAAEEPPIGLQHPTLGLRPLSADEVSQIVASALISSRFHDKRGALPSARVADPQALRATQDAHIGLQMVVDAALSRVPVLRFVQRLDAISGIIAQLETAKGVVLMASGARGEHDGLAWGAVAMDALRRASNTYREVFGVPMPWEAANRVAELTQPNHRDGLDAVMRAAVEALDGLESEHRTLRTHARLLFDAERELEGLRVPLLERLSVFGEPTSADGQRKASLELRRDASREQCKHGWSWLMKRGSESLQTVRPLRLRDAALVARNTIEAISREGRTVTGQQRAAAVLDNIRGILTQYGVGTRRSELMHALSQAKPSTLQVRDGSVAFFRALTPEALVGHVAGSRDLRSWQADYRVLAEKMHHQRERLSEHASKRAELDFWERLNIFSEENRNVRELRGEALTEMKLIQAQHADITSRFEAALWSYPPAWLYYALDPVYVAIGAIRVVSTQNGSSLRGVWDAMRALEHWSHVMVRAFGQLPSTHYLLELGVWSESSLR